MSLAAVHDGTHLCALLEWRDSSKSEEYKPWSWKESDPEACNKDVDMPTKNVVVYSSPT